MFERLSEIRQEVRDLASWLHREEPGAKEAECLLVEVTALENTCAAMRVLLSGRLAETELVAKARRPLRGPLGGQGHRGHRGTGSRDT